jgi:hypothetical protein
MGLPDRGAWAVAGLSPASAANATDATTIRIKRFMLELVTIRLTLQHGAPLVQNENHLKGDSG